jgi:hypothetical protein
VVHEGSELFLNILGKVDEDGVVTQIIALPDEINAKQTPFGFEGVAEDDGKFVVVVFQCAWAGDKYPMIGGWDIEQSSWGFVYYPLGEPETQAVESWVGLADIAPLGGGLFLVLERDDQAGPDAAIKRISSIGTSRLPSSP